MSAFTCSHAHLRQQACPKRGCSQAFQAFLSFARYLTASVRSHLHPSLLEQRQTLIRFDAPGRRFNNLQGTSARLLGLQARHDSSDIRKHGYYATVVLRRSCCGCTNSALWHQEHIRVMPATVYCRTVCRYSPARSSCLGRVNTFTRSRIRAHTGIVQLRTAKIAQAFCRSGGGSYSCRQPRSPSAQCHYHHEAPPLA